MSEKMEQQLFALSPLDGRYAEKISELRTYFSEFALIRERLIVEVEWFIFLSTAPAIQELPPLPESLIQYLRERAYDCTVQDALAIKKLEEKTRHDVKAIEYFLKQVFAGYAALYPYQEWLHFACTSEDINNLAYARMIKQGRDAVLLPVLSALTDKISALAKAYADFPMLARTHGQPASPTTLGKEFANVAYRLQRQVKKLQYHEILGKFNGATGNFHAHSIAYPEVDWPKLSQDFIEQLGLVCNPLTTQIEPHDFIVEIMAIISHANRILLDFSRDIWGYIALDLLKQKVKSGEVGSSTMPHKVNPIDFENAEGNLGLANALAEHFQQKLPISRWQRDLSDSTVLRNTGMIFGYSLLAYRALQQGLEKISPNQRAMALELESHPEVITEAIQTIMRRYGLENPYEQLKALSRGQVLSQSALADFVNQLPLPQQEKERLLALTPANYLGLAATLAKKIGETT
jgi:adenylosuccinate lyase